MSTDNINEDEMPTSIEIDNDFDIDLGGIDNSIPIMEKDPKAVLFIKTAKIKLNKKETGKNLVIFFSNSEPAVTTSGVTVPRGECLITKYYPLQPNADRLEDPDYNQERWKNEIAAFLDACFNTDKTNRPRLNPATIAELKGLEVLAKVEVDKAEAGYEPKNSILGLKAITDR
jgi:hypothetical protein